MQKTALLGVKKLKMGILLPILFFQHNVHKFVQSFLACLNSKITNIITNTIYLFAFRPR